MRTTLTRPERAWRLGPALAERAVAGDLVVRVDEPLTDIVDVWGQDSFPASDPPANW